MFAFLQLLSGTHFLVYANSFQVLLLICLNLVSVYFKSRKSSCEKLNYSYKRIQKKKFIQIKVCKRFFAYFACFFKGVADGFVCVVLKF